ncbi:MAG: hypothetical protein JNK05_11215 [Myxococcales bacterium]|nr:hypothetical protein [Myxococcales bacterium]
MSQHRACRARERASCDERPQVSADLRPRERTSRAWFSAPLVGDETLLLLRVRASREAFVRVALARARRLDARLAACNRFDEDCRMNTWLVVCPSCSRHVAANTLCPFCGATVTADSAPELRHARVHRAALIGLGAAIALSASCSPPYGVTPDTGIPQDAVAQDTGVNDGGGPAPAYGGAPTDGGAD